MKRTPLHKNIYKSGNKYVVRKTINKKQIYFKTCSSLHEAIKYRNKLKENNWEPLPETPEEKLEQEIKKYFMHIQVSGRYYHIRNSKGNYIGITKSIEEALYFKDLYLNTPKKEIPKDIDLKTDNPYYRNGLKYPLPERLIIPEHKSSYGSGSIVQKGPTSFHIHHGKKGNGFNSYICACPTLEMAKYVKSEMNKVDWDKSKLQDIIDDYPRYYTRLLFFYQYINKTLNRHPNSEHFMEQIGWEIVFPREYSKDVVLDKIYYSDIRVALFERDFLVTHNWDYDLLVETINDEENPYYDMELPTYPTRKIRNISDKKFHEEELTEVIRLIQEDKGIGEIAEILNVTPVTIRNWTRKGYSVSYNEFVEIVNNGENPLEVLEKKERVYQPDLSRALPCNWNNWVSYLQRNKTWQVRKGKVTYGTYPTEELAHKISNELQKVDWDKSKLKSIQAKFGHTPLPFSKRWVYKQGNKWAVRRKNKDRRMITYGVWYDKRIAILCRDMLLMYGFNLDNRDWINEMAELVIEISDYYPSTMFGRCTLEDLMYIESESKIPYSQKTSSGKYQITKTINGRTVGYGSYPEEKAKEIVAFLEDNNWDKNLLKVMQEMGEI